MTQKTEKPKGKLTIVSVDDSKRDNEVLRKIIEYNFSDEFELVAQFHTGKEALEKCPEIIPDVIMIDINTPDIDSTDLLKKLMKLCPSATFAMVSCCDDPDWMRDILLLGHRFFLTKPYHSHQLQHELRTIATIRQNKHQ